MDMSLDDEGAAVGAAADGHAPATPDGAAAVGPVAKLFLGLLLLLYWLLGAASNENKSAGGGAGGADGGADGGGGGWESDGCTLAGFSFTSSAPWLLPLFGTGSSSTKNRWLVASKADAVPVRPLSSGFASTPTTLTR
jgi:hypothetical protein